MKILFFSPHSLPWQHSFPEAILADSLRSAGSEIIYLTCGGIFGDYCIPKIVEISSEIIEGQSSKKCKSVCSKCQKTGKFIREGFDFSGPTIRSLITQDDIEEINKIISSLDITSATKLKHLGISIGKIAFYQIILRHKLINISLSKDLFNRYLSELRDTFYAAYIVEKLIKLNKIDAIILYNSFYSVNRIAVEIAKIYKIDSYFLHAGSNLSERLQTLMMGKDDDISFRYSLIKNWRKFSCSTFSEDKFKKVTDHFRELISAKSIFTYSSKKSSNFKNLREFFKISSSQKILVATMASYDEEIAVEFIGAKKVFENEIFSSQIDWIKSLISYATKSPNIFLIIRPHPREFSNKRDKMTSEHAKQILDLIDNGLPPNVKFNLPADGISLYDFIDQTDVFLNSWSNVGKEMAIFGVPVIIYSKNNLYYHPELNLIAANKNDYFEKIEEAIKTGWSFDWVVRSFKWYVYEQQIAVISLHSVCKLKEANSKNYLFLGVEKFLKIINPKLLYSIDMNFWRKGHLNGRITQKLIANKASTLLDLLDIKKEVSDRQEIDIIKIEFLKLLKILFEKEDALHDSRIFKIFKNNYLNEQSLSKN